MVEFFIRTWKDQLQAFVRHNDWDQFLHAVAYSYRTTINNATSIIPHHLALFGREAQNLSKEWLSTFWRQQGLTEHVSGIVDALKKTRIGVIPEINKLGSEQESATESILHQAQNDSELGGTEE